MAGFLRAWSLVSIRQTFSTVSSETLKKRAVEIPTRAEKIVAR